MTDTTTQARRTVIELMFHSHVDSRHAALDRGAFTLVDFYNEQIDKLLDEWLTIAKGQTTC